MMKYVIKLDDMYLGESILKYKIVFSPNFEDATFFKSMDAALNALKEHNLPEFCKIKQVTYVEHDIGYVEHEPLSK